MNRSTNGRHKPHVTREWRKTIRVPEWFVNHVRSVNIVRIAKTCMQPYAEQRMGNLLGSEHEHASGASRSPWSRT
jgi:hypothetical protein